MHSTYPPLPRSIWDIIRTALAVMAAIFCVEFAVITLSGKTYADLCDWDCLWYAGIVSNGYDLDPWNHAKGDAANWAFFPAFPIAASGIKALFNIDAALAVMLTSRTFLFTALIAFTLLVQSLAPKIKLWAAAAPVAANPYLLYANAGYTESLYLTLTCLGFYFMIQRQYVLSGLFGGLLSGTRFVGGAIGFSNLIWTTRRWGSSPNKISVLLGLALIPLGLASYMLFLHYHTGDALGFYHIQIAWHPHIGHPLDNLRSTLSSVISQALRLNFFNVVVTVTLALTIWAIGYLLYRRLFEMAIFSAISSIIPLLISSNSFPRYIWWQAPILIAFILICENRRWLFWLLVIGSSCFSIYVYAQWLDHKSWMI